MAKVQVEVVRDTLELGPFSIPADKIRMTGPIDYAKTGVVLVNDRKKVSIVSHIDGKDRAVFYTCSVYIQREAVGDDEQAKVDAVATERKDAKDAKEQAEMDKRERETKRAFELGQGSVVSALANIESLSKGFDTLARVQRANKPSK